MRPAAVEEAPRSILDDLGEEVTGIMTPISICMALTVFLVRVLNPSGTTSSSSVYIASIAYDEKSTDSASKKFGGAVLNAIIFVCVIAAMTVVLFLLFKYECYKLIHCYMAFAMFNIFFLLTGTLAIELIKTWDWHVDAVSFCFLLGNFSVVGTLGVLFIPIPLLLKQCYLVWSGITIAYIFTFIPEWTSWVLLILMALYDIAAVLMPGGPLKALVELAVTRQQELPALIYEARPTGRGYQRGYWGRGQVVGPDGEVVPDVPVVGTPVAPRPVAEGSSPMPALTAAGAAQPVIGSRSGSTVVVPVLSGGWMHEPPEEDMRMSAAPSSSRSRQSATNRSAGAAPGTGSGLSARRGGGPVGEGRERDAADPQGWRALDGGTTSTRASADDPGPGLPGAARDDELLRRDSTTPLVPADDHVFSNSTFEPQRGTSSRISALQPQVSRPSSGTQHRSNVTGTIESVRPTAVVDGVPVNMEPARTPRGPNGEPLPPRREEEEEEEDDYNMPDSIKLGLGDFIFYSMLVGRAAMYDYMTVFSCYLAVIAGLGLTLLCLSVFKKALPALPFSIALGVIFYFLTRLVLEPFMVPLMLNYTYF